MTNTNSIPFLDLVTPHAELREELCAVFNSALDTGGFIGGPAVQGFEEAFAKYCETQYCIGVGSGTDALRFAFIAAGIGPGDAVVTVPNTFIATTEAISQAGARPVFVDVDSATYNMDAVQLRRYLENQSSSIVEPDCASIKRPELGLQRSFPCTYTDKWPTWMRSSRSRKSTDSSSLRTLVRRTARNTFRKSKTGGSRRGRWVKQPHSASTPGRISAPAARLAQ